MCSDQRINANRKCLFKYMCNACTNYVHIRIIYDKREQNVFFGTKPVYTAF